MAYQRCNQCHELVWVSDGEKLASKADADCSTCAERIGISLLRSVSAKENKLVLLPMKERVGLKTAV